MLIYVFPGSFPLVSRAEMGGRPTNLLVMNKVTVKDTATAPVLGMWNSNRCRLCRQRLQSDTPATPDGESQWLVLPVHLLCKSWCSLAVPG